MHEIRLREPWKRAVCSEADRPADDAATKSGGILFHRNFNCPTGITSQQKLAIHIRLAAKISDGRTTTDSHPVTLPISSDFSNLGSLELNGELLEPHDEYSSGTFGEKPASPALESDVGGNHFPIRKEQLKSFNALSIRIHPALAASNFGPETKLTDLLSVALLIAD
ncbi:MAG: hypothetical protein ACE361_13605 [Aureliella sp.]